MPPLIKQRIPTRKIDALNDLDFLDACKDWSAKDMMLTVGRMLKGADHIARVLANAADSITDVYGPEHPASPKEVQALAAGLQATAKAIESYSVVYGWAMNQGRNGAEDALNAMDTLLETLDVHEVQQLRTWMQRNESTAA